MGPDKWDIVQIKAELLCMGLSPNEFTRQLYLKQNPYGEWKTGNVGVHICIENQTHVLVTVFQSFDKKSPYSLTLEEDEVLLLKSGKQVCRVKEVPMPHWYRKRTSTNIPMATLFLHEGEHFLHQTYLGCDYHSNGLQCRFCATGPQWRIGEPEDIGEAVTEAFKENPDYHICLGGGTRLPLRANVDYFSECAEKIRSGSPSVPVWVEMVPPEFDIDISKLVSAGVTSFGFNIEIWDDELRQIICPGKAKIAKGRYLEAMKSAIDVLGSNRVGSCLIVGLEPIESSITGASTLASIGVQPCMLAFKPWNGSLFQGREPCKASDLVKVSTSAAEAMIENDISPEKNQGCLLCDGCTIDHELYNFLKKN